ncbi:MAG: hypothetical protein J6A63_10050 [Clostridia bacterium]|nr:hypothetical protein [Clostridia bacterium]
MKRKTKVFVSSFAALAMSAALATGATYALFTSETQVDVSVSAGNVKINAAVNANSVEMWSRDVQVNGTFVNGGTAAWTDNTVTLERVTPGDKIIFNIDVTNQSDVAIQYRTVVACSSGLDLYEGLSVSLDYLNDTGADVQNFDGLTAYGDWTTLAGGVENVDTVQVTVELPYLEEKQDEYQGLATTLYYKVEAVQGNADVINAQAGETFADSDVDLQLISRKSASGHSFAGETITLVNDIDLDGVKWSPIGTEVPFAGTFDGNGHTVSNLTVTDMENAGFFDLVTSGATVKNVKFEDVNINATNEAAVVARKTTGSGLLFEDIQVLSGTVYGKNYAAAVVMNNWADDITVKNCVNKADVSGQRASGVTGWMEGANIVITDCVNEGNVTATRRAAGIAMTFNGMMTNCVNNGTVVGATASGEAVSGIVAIQCGASTYEYCVNNGDVSAKFVDANASAAGILGQTPGTKATLRYCVNTGNITAEGSRASGIAYALYGSATAYYCYNSGNVTGYDAVGGIMAQSQFAKNAGTAYNCVNAGTVTATQSGADVRQNARNDVDCYYYAADTLYAADGSVADAAAAVTVLNTGAASDMFKEENGKIVLA